MGIPVQSVTKCFTLPARVFLSSQSKNNLVPNVISMCSLQTKKGGGGKSLLSAPSMPAATCPVTVILWSDLCQRSVPPSFLTDQFSTQKACVLHWLTWFAHQSTDGWRCHYLLTSHDHCHRSTLQPEKVKVHLHFSQSNAVIYTHKKTTTFKLTSHAFWHVSWNMFLFNITFFWHPHKYTHWMLF